MAASNATTGQHQYALGWSPAPKQYTDELTALGNAGKLSGVPPQILSYIMEAESGPSYIGGAVNSSGYGGWYGLSAADLASYNVPTSNLTDTSQSAFDLQSEVAAAMYAHLLKTHNYNPIAAENAYQGAAGNGQSIFEGQGLQNAANALTLGGADAGGVTPANPFPGPLGAAAGFFTGGTSAPDFSTPWSFLNHLIDDITGGFGIGWKAVLTIIGGILLIGVGVIFVFRKQEAKVAEAGAAVA